MHSIIRKNYSARNNRIISVGHTNERISLKYRIRQVIKATTSLMGEDHNRPVIPKMGVRIMISGIRYRIWRDNAIKVAWIGLPIV